MLLRIHGREEATTSLLEVLEHGCKREPLSPYCYATHYLSTDPSKVTITILQGPGGSVDSMVAVRRGGRFSIEDLY